MSTSALSLDRGTEYRVYGAVLDAAELVDTVEDSDSVCALDDHVHWCLTKPRALANPITVKGKLNIWRWTQP